jgi:hypothetical protein
MAGHRALFARREVTMNRDELLEKFDREQRIDITFPDMRKETTPRIVRFLRDPPGMSFVLYSKLDEDVADAVIAEQIADFRERQLPFEWKLYDHDRPADLRQRLLDQGFTAQDPDAVMVLELAEAPATLRAPVAADVRPITEREQLEDAIHILEAVYGGDFSWVRRRLGDHLAVPDYVSIYVAYVADEPACVGWTYFHPDSSFASLWGGSTVPHLRRRGLYSAVLAARVQEALRRERRYLTIDAGPMSRPLVARHGFALLTHAHACNWQAPAAEEEATS